MGIWTWCRADQLRDEQTHDEQDDRADQPWQEGSEFFADVEPGPSGYAALMFEREEAPTEATYLVS
jgi:hypothetical protein